MDTKETAMSAGRILYSVPWIIFGAFHLMQAQNMAGLVPSYIPGNGVFWVYLTGIIFILAGLGILFKKYAKELSYLLALQLLIFVLSVWLPQLGGPNGQLAVLNVLKDTGLLGGALVFASLYTNGKE